jgi:hypothetical protein
MTARGMGGIIRGWRRIYNGCISIVYQEEFREIAE